jgi:glycosyltransferase involved in cell wall biosynthesis
MKVLFFMFAFPDMNKSFNMYTTLVEEFVNHGHDVTVVAPGKDKTGVYVENRILVLRVQTLPIKNVPNYLKGISNIFLPHQFERALNKFYNGKSFELIISATPPITLVDLASKLKKKFDAKFYLILRDIFPQNAVDLGFIKKNSLLHNYFRKKERKLYEEADFIGCMSQGNIDYVIKHNPEVTPNKLHELRNYQKKYNGFGSEKEALRVKYSIDDKFVIVFGGNMGKPQQLENVLGLAKKCRQFPDVLFLLLGEGVQMQKIAEEISGDPESNIRIHGTIPKSEYQDLLSLCQIGLISLNQNFTIPNIPSKTLDYFNVGLPVLASIDRCTDYGQVLDFSEAGYWAYADEPETLYQNFRLMYEDSSKRAIMGKNGRLYFEKHLLPEKAYRTIFEQLK